MALSEDDFTTDELAMIPKPDASEQAQMDAAAAAAARPSGDVPTDEPAADAPSDAPTTAATAAPATTEAAATPATTEKRGDTRAALRAARHAEQRERQRRIELEARLQELQAKLPAEAKTEANDDLSDEELAALEADYHPLVAKAARLAKKAVAAIPAATAAPAATTAPGAQTQFVPPYLPPDFQEAVDDVPDLLAWQNDPDQTLFEAAKAVDEYLFRLPAWKDKPHAERFREVVKRVQQDLTSTSTTTQQPTRANPEEAIAKAARATPSTLSDIGGGAGKDIKPANNIERYSRMTDEEVMADLARS